MKKKIYLDSPGLSWTLLDFRGFSPGLNHDATTTQPRRKHDAPGRNLDGGAGVMESWGNGAVMGAEPPAPPVTGEGRSEGGPIFWSR
jgi:hypothetical protein